MCLPNGGIVDDLVVYAFADALMLVANAANHDKDLAWIRAAAADLDVEITDRSDETALLAVQGPAARGIVEALADLQVDRIAYYRFAEGTVADVPAVVSATGYTGEDGFELYVAADDAVRLWRALLKAGKGVGLEPAGLGARDSLRLEMGYPLYGNDLDEAHTPLEGGLGWLTKLDKGDFIGRDALISQKERGLSRRLVGIVLEEKGFPRPGYALRAGGREVGVLSSGTLSPTLGKGIGMGYVPAELANPGTRLEVDLRGKPASAVVVSLPFHTKGSLRR
jgi:aminomethyltransferase